MRMIASIADQTVRYCRAMIYEKGKGEVDMFV